MWIKRVTASVVVCLIVSSWLWSVYADQTWTIVTSPPVSSSSGFNFHTATLLQDGRVLILDYKGSNPGVSLLYNPETVSWSITAEPLFTTANRTATLLQDGRVLVAGSFDGEFLDGSKEVQIYNPSTDTWIQAASMTQARSACSSCPVPARHTATRLQNGKVLVAGGDTSGGTSAEIYDPATNTWSPAANMNQGRGGGTATLLQDGRVLVVGGNSGPTTSAEIYSPLSNTWTPAGSLSERRAGHTATLLQDGRVLVVGGGNPNVAPDAEIYNPSTNTWSPTAPMILGERVNHASVPLTDGTVLVAGGGTFDNCAQPGVGYAEIYHPALNLWVQAADMNTFRMFHTATLLADDGVLVVGGTLAPDDPLAERFDETPVLAGGRPATDGFLAFGGVVISKTTTLSPCTSGTQMPLIVHTAVNGETVFPSSFEMTFNGNPVTLLSPLPAQGSVYTILSLQAGRNVLVGLIDGVVPGTNRTATDRDRVTIILP